MPIAAAAPRLRPLLSPLLLSLGLVSASPLLLFDAATDGVLVYAADVVVEVEVEDVLDAAIEVRPVDAEVGFEEVEADEEEDVSVLDEGVCAKRSPGKSIAWPLDTDGCSEQA